MNHKLESRWRYLSLMVVTALLILSSRAMRAETGTCGGSFTTLPFTDVQAGNVFFCSIAEAYFAGLTNGTTPTTYNPSDPVPREQMSAFITRTMDQSLKRGSKRAAMEAWWTPGDSGVLKSVPLGNTPRDISFDGEDLWSANFSGNSVTRFRASEGRVMQTWPAATGAIAVVVAAGKIFIAGNLGPGTAGKIYSINPEATSSGPVTVFESDIGFAPLAITFDGVNLWTANASGSISKVNVVNGIDSTFSGFSSANDILWDGVNLWVADGGDHTLKRVDPSNGTGLESFSGFTEANKLVLDGTNLWVSNFNVNSVKVLRATGGLRGTTLATITGNGIDSPYGMAFDGERVMVCNWNTNSVSLFNAPDFSPIGTLSTGANSHPEAVRSDGVNFWIVRPPLNDMVRF